MFTQSQSCRLYYQAASRIAAMERKASEQGMSKSQFMRAAMEMAMA